VRSLPAWFGVALVAGACFGWPLAWTLPVSVFGLLEYWGTTGDGYSWWMFSARPADDVLSTLLSICLFGAGISCYERVTHVTSIREPGERGGRLAGYV
jgi:hypothetical protein